VTDDRVVCGIVLHRQSDIFIRNAEQGVGCILNFTEGGIMTQVVREMLAHGFAVLSVKRIFGRVFSDNPALCSKRAFKVPSSSAANCSTISSTASGQRNYSPLILNSALVGSFAPWRFSLSSC
jgi:hypothetical protein